jgi:hypothetical protein
MRSFACPQIRLAPIEAGGTGSATLNSLKKTLFFRFLMVDPTR